VGGTVGPRVRQRRSSDAALPVLAWAEPVDAAVVLVPALARVGLRPAPLRSVPARVSGECRSTRVFPGGTVLAVVAVVAVLAVLARRSRPLGGQEDPPREPRQCRRGRGTADRQPTGTVRPGEDAGSAEVLDAASYPT
jgi:hypothetical protein